MDIQSIKNRFNIIGNAPALNHAIDVAIQVAATDLTVLIVGESGVGKEMFSQIIHGLSARKHNPSIAVNCGAIPEGTIDSELFGHEKGSFTGASDSRKGYFETVNGGTIFLDEIGEMPLGTQARLLRMLETGEFIRVGSSKVQKADVRVIAATNKDLLQYTQQGKFREDLYYRLSTVPIRVPSLRDRKEDILLLFRKFSVDFAERYKTTPVQLSEDAQQLLIQHYWRGNVRELKNIAEQISVLATQKVINANELKRFLPEESMNRMPILIPHESVHYSNFANERELLYKLFFDMKKDVTELKKMFFDILRNPSVEKASGIVNNQLFNEVKTQETPIHNNIPTLAVSTNIPAHTQPIIIDNKQNLNEHEEVEESLNIMNKEKELIIKALKKHKGKRKDSATDLGISERTLYRKLKDYDIEDQ